MLLPLTITHFVYYMILIISIQYCEHVYKILEMNKPNLSFLWHVLV